MTQDHDTIVPADWLEERLGQSDLKIVDGSWYLPAQKRDPVVEFAAAHIPGAVFFDQDRIVNPALDLPHALPTPRQFADHVGELGIGQDDSIVVYDGPGFFSAPRVWWMFRTFGARDVHILDGGFDGWQCEGRSVTSEKTRVIAKQFDTDFDADAIVDLVDMMKFVANGDMQIADARPSGRFTGTVPEPREGMRSGHMPGAFNIPALELSEGGHFLDKSELRARFAASGIDLEKPIVTSCGSGVTAAVLILALHQLGHKDHRLYDGSWSEWGGREDMPVETGSRA